MTYTIFRYGRAWFWLASRDDVGVALGYKWTPGGATDAAEKWCEANK